MEEMITKLKKKTTKWIKTHYLHLAVFNTLLVTLAMLNNAKYFDPYWLITINMVVLISLIFSIFLLGARSTALFLVTLFFWISAGIMKLFGVNVWAERIGVYVFESIFLGILLLFFESLREYNGFLTNGKD